MGATAPKDGIQLTWAARDILVCGVGIPEAVAERNEAADVTLEEPHWGVMVPVGMGAAELWDTPVFSSPALALPDPH